MAWVAARQYRQERFTRLILLMKFGKQGYSTKQSILMKIPADRPSWMVSKCGKTPVFDWSYPEPATREEVMIIPDSWSYCRLDIEIRMRAAFQPEIGEHGMVILDDSCPRVIIHNATEWWGRR